MESLREHSLADHLLLRFGAYSIKIKRHKEGKHFQIQDEDEDEKDMMSCNTYIDGIIATD